MEFGPKIMNYTREHTTYSLIFQSYRDPEGSPHPRGADSNVCGGEPSRRAFKQNPEALSGILINFESAFDKA
jgi:hypothetical protein